MDCSRKNFAHRRVATAVFSLFAPIPTAHIQLQPRHFVHHADGGKHGGFGIADGTLHTTEHLHCAICPAAHHRTHLFRFAHSAVCAHHHCIGNIVHGATTFRISVAANHRRHDRRIEPERDDTAVAVRTHGTICIYLVFNNLHIFRTHLRCVVRQN